MSIGNWSIHIDPFQEIYIYWTVYNEGLDSGSKYPKKYTEYGEKYFKMLHLRETCFTKLLPLRNMCDTSMCLIRHKLYYVTPRITLLFLHVWVYRTNLLYCHEVDLRVLQSNTNTKRGFTIMVPNEKWKIKNDVLITITVYIK